jgi:SWI/SNF-related matrix-associated actin-dependent regulator 1 of chromatin subfamily A
MKSIAHLESIAALPPGLLYPHQADGVAFLMSRKRALLADDMGLGKTRQAIVALQLAAPYGRILVVCPSSEHLRQIGPIWKRGSGGSAD